MNWLRNMEDGGKVEAHERGRSISESVLLMGRTDDG